MKFRIKPSDRVSVMGRTGSGKTTLLKAILERWVYDTRNWDPYHILILDTKKDGDFDGIGKKFHRLKDLARLWKQYRILIYEPHEEELAGGVESEYLNGFFRFIRMTREPLLLLVDELANVARGNNVSPEYELLMKQGRGKNQAVWAGIQNPVFVPHDFLSGANHYFVFDLLIEDDRKKVAKICGDGVMVPPVDMWEKTNPGANPEDAEHGFYYFQVAKRGLNFFNNEPAFKLPIPPDFNPRTAITYNGSSERLDYQGGNTIVNWKFVWSILVLALLMVLAIPLWKIAFDWLASKVPATQPVADYANRT